MRDCHYCHDCGTELRIVLDGEERCPRCGAYRRYYSHGWSRSRGVGDDSPCPPRSEIAAVDTKDAA